MGGQFFFAEGGELKFWEEGERVFFRAQLPGATDCQYKIWISGQVGHEMLLGTTGTDGNYLKLFRTISRSQLVYAGCWPVYSARAGRIRKAGTGGMEGWYCEEDPERLVPLLREREERTGAMLCRRQRGQIQLAAPYSVERPLAFSELFCFASPRMIHGKLYLVWAFDGEGKPKC